MDSEKYVVIVTSNDTSAYDCILDDIFFDSRTKALDAKIKAITEDKLGGYKGKYHYTIRAIYPAPERI